MILKNSPFKFLIIIIISGIWTLIIPGYVAYRDNVFYGNTIKLKISDSIVNSKLLDNEGAKIEYPRDLNNIHAYKKKTIVIFSGFGDHRLNFIWFSSYIVMLLYIFIINRNKINIKLLIPGLILGVLSYLLFQGPNWFRNTELGRVGRTIYTFVNIDVDAPSFFLQEARAFIFTILLGIIWSINEHNRIEQKRAIVKIYKDLSEKNLLKLSIRLRKTFYEWQRDTILIIILFVPWTWFYWKNISVYGDQRYLFAAIIFHTFWIVSIIIITMPFLLLSYGWWKLKLNCLLNYSSDNSLTKTQSLIYGLDPIPRGQLFFSGITTFISLISPFIQILFK